MKLRVWMCAMVVVASACASEAVYAAPVAVRVPVHAMFGRTKLIKFDVRNDGKELVKLRCGEQTMSVAPGKTMHLELPVGAQVTAAEATSTMAAGATVVAVTAQTSDVTVVLH